MRGKSCPETSKVMLSLKREYHFHHTPFYSVFLLSLVFIVGSRLIANSFFSERSAEKRVVIYGAGSAGIQLANGLRFSREMKAIAFVDLNEDLHNTFISGIKVISPKNLRKMIKRNKIDEVYILTPKNYFFYLPFFFRKIKEDM